MQKDECVVCGDYLDDMFTQTAEPVKVGKCCTICLENIVAPARHEAIRQSW